MGVFGGDHFHFWMWNGKRVHERIDSTINHVFLANHQLFLQPGNARKPNQRNGTTFIAKLTNQAGFTAFTFGAEATQHPLELYVATVFRKVGNAVKLGFVDVTAGIGQQQIRESSDTELFTQQFTFFGANPFEVFNWAIQNIQHIFC